MKITNRLGLPQALVDAIKNDDYDKGDADISVTQLLDPPRKVALVEAHAADLEEDASDRLYALFGKIGHGILEQANGGSTSKRLQFFEALSDIAERLIAAEEDGKFSSEVWQMLKEMVTWRKSNTYDIVEKRFFMPVGGWTISGKFDTLTLDDAAILSDYKFSTVWKAKSGECPPEFEAQVNILAELLTYNGITVKAGRVYLLLRDWSKAEAARDPSYPQQQVVPYDLRLWSSADRLELIERLVASHQAARLNLPLCSDNDRWMKPAKFAVMKEGRTRAVKLFDSEGEAMAWISGQKDSRSLYIDHRVAEPTRCRFYCSAAAFCTQYQDFQSRQAGRTAPATVEDDVL